MSQSTLNWKMFEKTMKLRQEIQLPLRIDTTKKKIIIPSVFLFSFTKIDLELKNKNGKDDKIKTEKSNVLCSVKKGYFLSKIITKR